VLYALAMAALLAWGTAVLLAHGPQQSPGWVHWPDSSIERLGDVGAIAHTNHLIHVRPDATGTTPTGQVPETLFDYYTDKSGAPPNGGHGVIAIVDAYHYATALADFNTFSREFGLPTEPSKSATSKNTVFQVVYASGSQPRANCGWAQEEALDIEWAHAMAPAAKIVLVEAASASFADLFKAVDAATSLVKTAGGGEVSMSWGGSEFSGEAADDSHFAGSDVVYFASSGDTGGATIYPSASPDVVAAGGTTLTLSGGSITGETGWSGSGGGPSKYERVPAFQDSVPAVETLVGQSRGVPDVSFDADPQTGVSVYDSTSCEGMSGWMVFGGTSVAAPSLAGLTNSTGTLGYNSLGLLDWIYGNMDLFHDVKSGSAGSYKAQLGWDFVTGVGTPGHGM
jgi:subtilase family serine protease